MSSANGAHRNHKLLFASEMNSIDMALIIGRITHCIEGLEPRQLTRIQPSNRFVSPTTLSPALSNPTDTAGAFIPFRSRRLADADDAMLLGVGYLPALVAIRPSNSEVF